MDYQQDLRHGLNLLLIEMMVTKTIMAMAILTPFFYSIGMDQYQIGLSQAACNTALLVLNQGTGWLADKFSRRWCNFTGDTLIVISLVAYSQAEGFTHVVLCEILFGIGAAFSDGADSGLLNAFCYLIAAGDQERKVYLLHKYNSLTAMVQPLVQAGLVFVGGLIGAESQRLAIGLSALPYACGMVCMLFMREVGEKYVSVHKNPLRDMWELAKRALAHRQLRLSMFAYAIGREVTHVMVWGATPLLVLAGASALQVATWWTANGLAAVLGSFIAKLYAPRLPEWLRFALPVGVVVSALTTIYIRPSLTIWLYIVMGLVMGWTGAALTTMIQRHTPEDIQSSVMSLAKSGSQILYIPLIPLIGWIGKDDIRLTLPAIALIFTLLAIPVVWRMRKM